MDGSVAAGSLLNRATLSNVMESARRRSSAEQRQGRLPRYRPVRRYPRVIVSVKRATGMPNLRITITFFAT